MPKLEITIFTQARKHGCEGRFVVEHNALELLSNDYTTYITLHKQTVEIDEVNCSDDDVVNAHLDYLKRTESVVKNKAEKELEKIASQINELTKDKEVA